MKWPVKHRKNEVVTNKHPLRIAYRDDCLDTNEPLKFYQVSAGSVLLVVKTMPDGHTGGTLVEDGRDRYPLHHERVERIGWL